MHNIAILASGSGSNALKIIEHFKANQYGQISLVVTNRKEAGVIGHAKDHGVPWLYIPGSVWKLSPEDVLTEFRSRNIDFLVLAGFLLMLPKIIVHEYEGRAVNIHPALLPDFGGEGMYGMNVHKAVISSGRAESGISIHYLSEEYDQGAIIYQARVAIESSDTAEDVQKKIQVLEHRYYAPVIEDLLKSLSKK